MNNHVIEYLAWLRYTVLLQLGYTQGYAEEQRVKARKFWTTVYLQEK